MQGKTLESIILSLNSCVSKKIKAVDLSTVYVGCSRVHDHDGLRTLPLSDKDIAHLTKLQWHPYLRMFFNNYDDEGKWKPEKLKKYREEFVKNVKLD